MLLRSEEEEANVRRTPLLDPRPLHVFDMDGTLALTAEPDKHRALYQAATGKPFGKGWWSRPETLRPPFPLAPIHDVVARYHQARRAGDHVVVMTGRQDTPAMRDAVDGVLHHVGVTGHTHGKDLFLKPHPDMDTAEWKKAQLYALLTKHRPSHVHIYDDREDHTKDFSRLLGSLFVPHSIYHVRHPGWGAAGTMPKTS